jgi:hypothetical protein
MSDRPAIDALEDLGQQFGRLERAGRPVRDARRRVPAVAILVGAVLVGSTSLAVAAATGVFDRQPDGLVRQSVPRTIASGNDELFGRWSAVTYSSDQGLCLDVTVEHNIAEESLMSGSCGGDHAITRDGGGPVAAKTFLYCLAPYAASNVKLQVQGEPAVTVPTHPVSPDIGAFYFVSLDKNVGKAEAVPLSAIGAPVGPALFSP